MPDTQHLLGTAEVAAVFGVSTRTIMRWTEAGLRTQKIPTGPNGAYVFDQADVEEFGRQLRELAAVPPADQLPGMETGS